MMFSLAPLLNLCAELGIAADDLARVERTHELAHTFTVPGNVASGLRSDSVEAALAEFGDSLQVEIRTGDLTELMIRPGMDVQDVARFSSTAAAGGPYDVVVRIDKQHLVDQMTPAPRARHVELFVFSEALTAALERGITHFESDIWPDGSSPLVVAVLNAAIDLTGPHLTVLGGSSLTRLPAVAAMSAAAPDRSAAVAARDRYIGWDAEWVKSLTPWHFNLVGTCADERLLGLLHAQLLKLCILFTCDRARRRLGSSPGEFLAEFRGREHVAAIPIDERRPMVLDPTEVSALVRMVDWCYQQQASDGQPDWLADRLPFMQIRVAQVLETYPADARLEAYAHALRYLLEGVEWHWKAFIEGKVNDYLDRVQLLESLVDDTVSDFNSRVGDMVNGLTDTMLAAVAVLIGSFIASAFATPFNGTLFRIGVLTDGAYILIFPGLIGLAASWNRMTRASGQFTSKRGRYDEILLPDKVNEIVGTKVTDVQRFYTLWWWVTAACYIAVAVAAVVAAAVVPHAVSSTSGRTPSTTPSATRPA